MRRREGREGEREGGRNGGEGGRKGGRRGRGGREGRKRGGRGGKWGRGMEGNNREEAEGKGKSKLRIYTTSYMAAISLCPPPTLPVSPAVRWSMQGTG